MKDYPVVLIIEITNNNHHSNSRTIQSIFRQDYPVIEFVVLNDDTPGFLCEELIYSITDHTPSNIKQVQIVENPYPVGDISSVRSILRKRHADYVIILHAGEVFSSDSILRQCVDVMERASDADLLAAPIKENSTSSESADITWTPSWSADIGCLKNRDSMFFYRANRLLEALDAADGSGRICDLFLSGPQETQQGLFVIEEPICSFSAEDVAAAPVSIPKELGHERLNAVRSLLNASALTPQNVVGIVKKPPLTPARKRILWLYKHSRLVKLKMDILIDLMMMCLAILLITEQVSPVCGIVVAAAAFFMALWIGAMLVCNLFFKKHPERIVM